VTTTYTSDHHLTISIEGRYVTSQYKGNVAITGSVDDNCRDYIPLVFEDLNRQHDNVSKLRAALISAIDHLPEHEVAAYKKVLRSAH
jgi:hypothetical protein